LKSPIIILPNILEKIKYGVKNYESYSNLKVIKNLISIKSEKLAGIVIYQKVEYERNHLSRR
jgi:hypothetical protein